MKLPLKDWLLKNIKKKMEEALVLIHKAADSQVKVAFTAIIQEVALEYMVELLEVLLDNRKILLDNIISIILI